MIGGGAIAYLNFVQRAPKSLSPAGTQLVPKDAIATMTVTTDELTWIKLRQFGTAETQQQFDALLSDWKDRLFTDNGYSYKRDIKPWIGDRVTLAFLPDKAANRDQTAGGGLTDAIQNVVLVVPIAEPMKAKSLLKDGPKNPTVKLESRSYKGIDIQTLKSADGDTTELAVIGAGWLLLSNSTDGIEQAINTYKGGRSLLNIADYRKAATRIESPQPPGKNFAQIYLNIPAATRVMATPSGTGTGSDNRSILPLQGSEGIVATALVESEGMRFLGTSWLAPKNDLAYSELSNEAGEMPRRMPGDTLVMMSGGNLQQFWRGLSEGNTSPPFLPDPQNLKAGLLTQTGLDLDEDIMPWAAGEFALGLLPPLNTEAAATGVEPQDSPVQQPEAASIESAPLMIMVQTSDREAAESVWAQLDDVMVSKYRFEVKTEDFEGGSLTKWNSPFQGVQFSHGWLPGNITFFAVGNGVADVIAPTPSRSLAETRTFQTLTSQAPKPNNGHFYIDLTQINALNGEVFPLPQLSADGPTAAIQAVGLTASVDRQTMDYDLYIKLAKGSKPGAL